MSSHACCSPLLIACGLLVSVGVINVGFSIVFSIVFISAVGMIAVFSMIVFSSVYVGTNFHLS